MDQIWSVTHRDEKFWRLMVALFGTGMYAMVTVMIPAYSTIPPVSPAGGIVTALFAMVALGALFISLSPVVWKYWLTALFELAATGLAVCAAWVYVEGMPGVPSMPPTLWPFFAFVLSFLAGTLAVFSGFLRVTKTVEPDQSYDGTWGRMLWEGLLPYAMGGGTFFALGGSQIAAAIFVLVLMTVLMLWAPGWKTSEIQTCCPG